MNRTATISSTNSTPWRRAAWLAFALGAPLLWSAPANAQQACGDTTCPKGFTCETQEAACPAIACVDEANCRPCEPTTVNYCVPAACETDSDCGDGMVCYEHESRNCTGVGQAAPCPPGAECDAFVPERPEVECTTSTVKSCTPRWQLPCQVAADCGAGFTCVEQELCSAPGGSAGTPTPSAPTEPAPAPEGFAPTPPGSGSDGAPPRDVPPPPADPAPPPVSCEPSGYFSCVVIETACTTNADCLSGWTCETNPRGVCWASSDGQTGCEPADPEKICQPPYQNWGGGRGGFDEGGPGTGGPDAAPGTPAIGTPTNGSPGASPTPAPPVVPTGEDAVAGGSGAGCSVGPAGSSASGWALAALGLAAALRLRRRR